MTGLTRVRTRRRLRRLRGTRRPVRRPLVVLRSRLAAALAVAVLGGCGWAVEGPVAGAVVTAYAIVALTFAVRRRRAAVENGARSVALDSVAGFAADLRAGISPAAAWPAARGSVEAVRFVRDRVAIASRVADATGAPLADLLDRLQSDLRSLDRIRLAAEAHASGIRATAGLLAVLPVAGVALGYGMGGDPIRVLLHTPLGAGCAIVATLLQAAGFGWTSRLAAVTR